MTAEFFVPLPVRCSLSPSGALNNLQVCVFLCGGEQLWVSLHGLCLRTPTHQPQAHTHRWCSNRVVYWQKNKLKTKECADSHIPEDCQWLGKLCVIPINMNISSYHKKHKKHKIIHPTTLIQLGGGKVLTKGCHGSMLNNCTTLPLRNTEQQYCQWCTTKFVCLLFS